MLEGRQTLLDVAYAPWPTPLARSWQEAGGRVVHGLEMLVHQAVHQIRIFVAGDAAVPLADEAVVIEAMRAAAGSSAVE
jgi:shikimate dehydrogenase